MQHPWPAQPTNHFPTVLVFLVLQAAWDSKQEVAVKGPIDSRHLYFDITNMQVRASNFTRAGKTCVGAMGWSFAAGTTDGEQGWDAPCSITLSSTAVIHVSMPKLHHPRRDGCIVFSTRIASYVTFLRMTAEHGWHGGGLLTAALPDQHTELVLVCLACAHLPRSGVARLLPGRQERPQPPVHPFVGFAQRAVQSKAQQGAGGVPTPQAHPAECGGGPEALPLRASHCGSVAVPHWEPGEVCQHSS
jgi:hypothetical protein